MKNLTIILLWEVIKIKKKIIFYWLLPIFFGTIVGIITSSFINYRDLIQPPFSPPGFIFPIIWSILYLLMGISYSLLKNKTKEIKNIYYLQLGVNYLWSIIFFAFKWRLIAIIWIILLDILVFIMLLVFKRENKVSFYLQIPYFIWCLFATYLTIGIYLLN